MKHDHRNRNRRHRTDAHGRAGERAGREAAPGREIQDRFERLCDRSNLTRRQLLIWLAQSMSPGNPVYSNPTLVTIHGRIDGELFRRAFCRVVAESDGLRTVFSAPGGMPRQSVLPSSAFEPDRVDLSHAGNAAAAAGEFIEKRGFEIDLASRPFDAAFLDLPDGSFGWYMNFHHLVIDAWSFSLIFQHVSRLYGLWADGSDAAPLALPPYADYLQFEREYRNSDRHGRIVDFWNGKLAKHRNPLALYGRQAGREVAPATRLFRRIEPESVRLLCDLASKQAGRKLHDDFALLSSLAVVTFALFHRLSGDRLQTIGLPAYNRRGKRFRETIGLFMEILPLQIEIDRGETLLSLLEKNVHEIYALLRHSACCLRSDLPGALYNVMLNLNRVTLPDLGGFQSTGRVFGTGFVEAGQSMVIQVHVTPEDPAVLVVDFSDDVFGPEEREQWLDQFFIVIDALIRNPESRVDAVDITARQESKTLIESFSRSRRCDLGSETVVDLFEKQAATAPESTALSFRDRDLSYREVDERADRLAGRLLAAGLEPDSIVGVSTERSLEMIVAIVAVWKAGAAYLPLSRDYPEERLRFMIRDSRASLIIRDRTPAPWLEGTEARTLFLDEEKGDVGLVPKRPPEGNLDRPAYLLYTSGSTGRPKGYVIEQRGIANLALDCGERFAIKSTSRFLQFASFSFDLSVMEFAVPLCRGATVVLDERAALTPGPAMVKLMRERAVTHAIFTPSTLSALPFEPLPDLEVLVVAGEECPADLPSRWGEGRRFFNGYGPAETTVISTVHECGRDETGPPPIGRPLLNTTIYILDGGGNPAPIGVAGEIYIGGAGVGRGYNGLPDLTAQRYVTIELPNGCQERLFRSGDRGRFRRDGSIEFAGRIDRQTKIRGFRVEPQEVELALLEHEEVNQCAVTTEGDQAGARVLAAHVVSPSRVSTMALRGFLRRRLPDYMIPYKIVLHRQLPLTANGKVDLAALSARSAGRVHETGSREPPRSGNERILARIVADLLQIREIGRSDNFFDLGGNSLIAVEFVDRAAKEGFRFSIHDLFLYPSVEALARTHDLSSGAH